MTNPIEIRVTDSADKFASERASRLGGDLAGWNPNQSSHKAPVRAEMKTGVYQTIAGQNGGSTVLGKGTAYASDGLRPGHVVINGVETTIEAARKAGFDVSGAEGEQRRPFGQQSRGAAGPSAAPFPTIPTGDPHEAIKRADRARGEIVGQEHHQKPQNGPQEATSGQEQGSEGVTPEEIAKAASESIQAIERVHGPQAVDAGLENVSDSGYLPDAGQLPQGVTMEAVEKIVAGYTAQANDALSGVGASVDMLMETLDDDALREARWATITGDRTKLEHLGRQAANRLAQMPEADPEAFAEMVGGMSPAERAALSQNARGDWVVTVPGRKPMGFAAAVRAGIVKV